MQQERFKQLRARLDRSSHTPIYCQIQQRLEEMLASGELRPGDRLPGDVLLGNMLHVNAGTIRKAFAPLVEQDLLRRTRKSGTFVTPRAGKAHPSIGFFYFREAEEHMSRIAEFAQARLAEAEFDLKLVGFDRDYYERVDLCQVVRQKGVAGAIIVALNVDSCRRQLLALEQDRFPHVRIGNSFFANELKAPLVRGHDPAALRRSFEYLWERGHRRIGFISNRLESEIYFEYLALCEARGVLERRRLMATGFAGPHDQWRQFPGPQVARGYLEENPDLSAVVVEHSAMALDLLRQAQTLRREVPRELSIISIRDWDAFEFTTPRITAMDFSEREMGERAADALLDVLRNGPRAEAQVTRIEASIVERDSVARVAAGDSPQPAEDAVSAAGRT